MGILSFVKNKQMSKIEENITKEELSKLRDCFADCEKTNINELKELMQNIEIRKAKKEDRPYANIYIDVNLSNHNRKSDEFSPSDNLIVLHFPNKSIPELFYASYIHESTHAYQESLKHRNTFLLSEFDKNVILSHKVAECYNLEDERDDKTIQYLYNYNEMDSKIAEVKAILEILKCDISRPKLIQDSVNAILDDLNIYNKGEFKQYIVWQQRHYEAYKNQSENDFQYIMPMINELEKELDINVGQFLKESQFDLSYAKFTELISLRNELNKINNLLQKTNNKEKQVDLLRKHFNIKEENNPTKDKKVIDDDIEI